MKKLVNLAAHAFGILMCLVWMYALIYAFWPTHRSNVCVDMQTPPYCTP